jgi:hypothetical protein
VDTNSDSDTDSIDSSIDASGILDNPGGDNKERRGIYNFSNYQTSAEGITNYLE